jgi:hypothetical protein
MWDFVPRMVPGSSPSNSSLFGNGAAPEFSSRWSLKLHETLVLPWDVQAASTEESVRATNRACVFSLHTLAQHVEAAIQCKQSLRGLSASKAQHA